MQDPLDALLGKPQYGPFVTPEAAERMRQAEAPRKALRQVVKKAQEDHRANVKESFRQSNELRKQREILAKKGLSPEDRSLAESYVFMSMKDGKGNDLNPETSETDIGSYKPSPTAHKEALALLATPEGRARIAAQREAWRQGRKDATARKEGTPVVSAPRQGEIAQATPYTEESLSATRSDRIGRALSKGLEGIKTSPTFLQDLRDEASRRIGEFVQQHGPLGTVERAVGADPAKEPVNRWVGGLVGGVAASPLDFTAAIEYAGDPKNPAFDRVMAAASTVPQVAGAGGSVESLLEKLASLGVPKEAVQTVLQEAGHGRYQVPTIEEASPVAPEAHTGTTAVVPQVQAEATLRPAQVPKTAAMAVEKPPVPELLGPIELNSGLNLSQLADSFNVGKSGAKLYSGPFDRLKNIVSSGLQTTERVAPRVALAIRKLGNSKGEANLISKGLVTGIDRQAGETGFFLKRVVPLLVDSRLQGIAKRYVDSGDLESSLKVKRAMSDADFAKGMADPKVQEALKAYKASIEKALAESHGSNEGVFSDALGPLDTYYPLTALDESGAAMKGGWRKGALLQKPGNPRSRMATGMGHSYDLSPEGFNKAVAAMVHTNNRGAMVQAFKDSGFAKVVKSEEAHLHPTIEINGVTWDARAVPMGSKAYVTADGQIGHTSQVAIVPSGMASELSHALAEGLDASSAKGFTNVINHIALQGLAEPVVHSLNLIGTIITEPTVGGLNPFTKVLGNLPGIGSVSKTVEALGTSTVDAAAMKDLQEMARIGLLPSKTGKVTWSKSVAQATGAERKFDLSPLLYGEKGIDTKARLYLYRLAKASGLTSDVDIAAMVNRLPEYNKAAEGILERGLKRSGVAPFYTAGKTMLRNGVDAFSLLNKGKRLANSPQKNQIVLAHHLSHGVVGFTGLWVGANLAVTGKLPWENGSQFGQINLGNGQAVNLGILNPVVMRGASATGLKGAYDAYAQGGGDTEPYQMLEAGIKGSVNALAHPVTGAPIVRMGSIALTGSEPSIASLRDLTGQQSVSLYRGAPQTGSDQVRTNVVYGAAHVNSFALQALIKMGVVAPVYDKEADADPFAAIIELSGIKPMVKYDQDKKHERLLKEARRVQRVEAKR